MNSLWHEFRNAFFQTRFEGERMMAVMPLTLLILIAIVFTLSTVLFAVSMIAISMGGAGVPIGFEGGVVACVNIFLTAYLHGIYERSKTPFYDQSFRPDIYDHH